MAAKNFIDAGRATNNAGGFRNTEGGEKPRGGQQQQQPAQAAGNGGFISGGGGDGGMSRFDRLVSNRDFEDEEHHGGNDEPAACPYGAMGGGSASASASGSPQGGIQRSDFTNSGGGIELGGGGEEDDESSDGEVEIMAPEEAVQVRLSGYMKKFAVGRSGFFKNWKRRFFVCDGGVLQYFESETSKEALSTIDLAGGAGLRLVTCPTTKTHPEVLDADIDMVLVFREAGSAEERKLLMRADTPDEHTQWAVVIGAFTPLVDHPMDFPVQS